jgi:Protein of unknown function (DUF3185)
MRSGTTRWSFITSGTLRDSVRGKGNSAACLGTAMVDFNLSRLWSILGQSSQTLRDRINNENRVVRHLNHGGWATRTRRVWFAGKPERRYYSRKFGSRLVECRFIKGENMSKAVSLALLAGGILLIVFGVMASTSFTSDISRFFTGSPTDKAIWMLLGGVVASIVGVVGLLRG